MTEEIEWSTEKDFPGGANGKEPPLPMQGTLETRVRSLG